MAKKAFRVESGLDAGGFNVSNVADPRDNIQTDAVNVQYFIRENTVQPFDSNRTYKKDFAVTYENRLWIALVDINTQKPFDYTEWKSLRTDPSWKVVTGTPDDGTELVSGDYITAYSVNSELTFKLPATPAVGDTIVIKDEGGYCNLNKILVKAPAKPFEDSTIEKYFTIPGSMKYFIYSSTSGGRWIVHTSVDKIPAKIVSRTDQPNQLASGDMVYRKSSTGHITMQLPKYAENGDVISTYDLEGLTSVNGVTMQVHPQSGYFVGKTGQTTISSNTGNLGHFVFNSSDKVWVLWDGDNRSRWKPISANTQSRPMDQLAVVGGSGDLDVTLPENAENGDFVRLSNYYRIDGLTVNVKVATGSEHKIVGDLSQFKYPKFKDVKNLADNPTVTEIAFTGLNYGAVVEFFYNNVNKTWMASSVDLRTEHVDETNRDRPGVAPLASQTEVNKNHEDNPRDDMMITPKTLANKTANETRRGVARIAKAIEVQLPTDSPDHLNDVIVTPKRLNERQATETIRGVAEVATQTEANTNNNDTHIITPMKLDARRGSVDMAGVVKIIAADGVAATSRTVAGTGVYNWSPATHGEPFVLTPRSLNEAQATENSRGVAYVATQSEANAQGGATSDAVMITPKKLDARRATDTMAGIAEIATQAEANTGTDYTRIITPKTLHDRRATESLHGLAEIATQVEVNTGTDDTRIITPKKFAGWLALDHFISNTDSGINHSSSLWNKVNLDIHEATETQRGTLRVATQAEANAENGAAQDSLMITAKKLDGRRATETQTGIARLATQAGVDAETEVNTIVTPKKLADYIHKATTATSTEAVNGTVKTASLADCFVGNKVDGSTQAVASYKHFPTVVTPRGLNFALQNFLPKEAKAVDSDKLDGLDSLQFLRSDEDDTMTGNLTVTGFVSSTLIHDKGYSLIKAYGSQYDDGSYCRTYYRAHQSSTPSVKAHALIVDAYKPANGGNPAETFPMDIYLSGNRVYHQGFRPTPAEIGAYTKAEADAKFVDVAGDTMTGDLSLPGIKFTGGNSNKWRFFAHPNGNIQFDNNNVAKWYMNQNGDMTINGYIEAASVKVGAFHVIETDGKIHWNKLKGVPAATTTQAGIVQLSNVLDNASTTQAPTANTIKILKEMIDEKAGITGAIMNDLKIKNWIRIGNVILRPNPANKTLDFIWTDDPIE